MQCLDLCAYHAAFFKRLMAIAPPVAGVNESAYYTKDFHNRFFDFGSVHFSRLEGFIAVQLDVRQDHGHREDGEFHHSQVANYICYVGNLPKD